MEKHHLSIFSPLPPEENGIADYTSHLLNCLSDYFSCSVFVKDPCALAHPEVTIRDAEQAFRYIDASSRLLHQIGNNPGHVFVLQALRNWGGVTTLHDQNLHYLYEIAGSSENELARRMTATSVNLGAVFARHLKTGIKSSANYALFDMAEEILDLSDAVIVHSQFAKRRLSIIYGHQKTSHIYVVPHLALPIEIQATNLREQLGLDEGVLLIVTCGFATAAKRFDWLITALDEISRRGLAFYWVHAGKERPEEFSLSEYIGRYPSVVKRSRVTGYLSEIELNRYIVSSDILVNLRYPSVGESSGTLARAMAAGKCCIVSDTAAYSDIPRDAVIHIPIGDPVNSLIQVLEDFYLNTDARAEIGAAARRLAANDWSPGSVATAYRDVILQSHAKQRPKVPYPSKYMDNETILLRLAADTNRDELAGIFKGRSGKIDIIFECRDLETMTEITLQYPLLLSKLIPDNFIVLHIKIEVNNSGFRDATKLRVCQTDIVRLRVRGLLN